MNTTAKTTSLDRQIAELLGIIRFLEMPEDEQQRRLDEAKAEARRRTAARNARFAAALTTATDVQAARISKLETDGMRVIKLWRNRETDRIAVMLQRDNVWNQATGRMSTKLAMVYPDGRWQEAFSKIALQNGWF